nr:hypothetical protein [Tanacetum cinerariifolium]GEY70372.1 hypothetical protein [Tanacetum cinerariifolium]
MGLWNMGFIVVHGTRRYHQDWGSSRLRELHWVPINTLSDVFTVKQGEREDQMKKTTRAHWMMIWRFWNGLGLRNISGLDVSPLSSLEA